MDFVKRLMFGWFAEEPSTLAVYHGEEQASLLNEEKSPAARRRAAVSEGEPSSAKRLKLSAEKTRVQSKTPKRAESKLPKGAPKSAPPAKRPRSQTPTKKATPKKKDVRPASANPGSAPAKVASKSSASAIHWQPKGSTTLFAKDKKTDVWYLVRPVDVIAADDARQSTITASNIKSKRGASCTVAKTAAPELVIHNGDWVRVHYHGYSSTYDEWILYCKGGFLCTDEKSCKCARHA